MSLGPHLLLELQRKGWTAAELARRAGYHKATVSSWLADDPEPPYSALFKLAEVMGSRALYLMALGKSVEPLAREFGPTVERLQAAGVRLREGDGIRTCERELEAA